MWLASLRKPRLKLNGVVGFSGGTGWHIMVVCVSVRKRERIDDMFYYFN